MDLFEYQAKELFAKHAEEIAAGSRQALTYSNEEFIVKASGIKARYVMDKLDMILLMSVNPGFGGQKFIPATFGKLREARALIDASGYPIRLEVDGGIGVGNIRAAAEAGADTFVAGSAIFGTADYARTIAAMRAELAQVQHG